MIAKLDPIAAALKDYTSCDVSDALVKLGVAHGGFLSGPTMFSPQRQEGDTKIVGRAYTVQYVLLSDTTSPKPAGHYIDSVPNGAVVVISSPKTINAVWGSLMSCRAMACGAVGTVVDGRVRDLQDHRAMGYPIFARSIGTAAPYEVARVSGINVPLTLDNEGEPAAVNPGDYIVADLNGVVCIPSELVHRTIELIAPQAEADAKIAEDLRGDATLTFVEASRKHRAGLKQA